MKRPFETWFLILFLVLLAANAFYGGFSFMLKPDGSLLGINPTWLSHSPFSTYFIPGILLILFLGVLPVIALIGMFSKKEVRLLSSLNFFPDKYWGWSFALYTGIITNIWIIVQQLFIGYFILQSFIAAVGTLIIVTCLLPRIQQFYSIEKIDSTKKSTIHDQL